MGCEAYKRRLAYNVTVRISAQNDNSMLLLKVLLLKYWRFKQKNLYALLYIP